MGVLTTESSLGGGLARGRGCAVGDEGLTDSSGAPLVPDTIVCIDCGGIAHLLTRHDDTERHWPGDLVVYRCEDCNDRWDLIVPEEGPPADDHSAW